MSYQQSAEAIIKNANQYIEANSNASWFQVPNSPYDLTKLKLTDVSDITTFEPLKKFKALTVLFFGDRLVRSMDFSTLVGLEEATLLEGLSFNAPTIIRNGITAIGHLKQLKRLGLFHVNHPVPADLLQSLDQLLWLSLGPKNYASIAVLPSNILSLTMHFNSVTNIPNWNVSPSVQRVSLGKSSCALTSLDSLKIFPNIQFLELDHPKALGNIDQAKYFKQLKTLEINLSAIENLKALAGHPTLETLKVRGTKISGISELSGCKRLKELIAEKSTLISIEGVDQISSLQSLWIGETRVSDLSPLSGMTSIEELNLSELAPRSWEVLPTLTGLKTIDLSHSTFNDTGLLFRLPHLRFVNLKGCPVDINSKRYQSFVAKLNEKGGNVR